VPLPALLGDVDQVTVGFALPALFADQAESLAWGQVTFAGEEFIVIAAISLWRHMRGSRASRRANPAPPRLMCWRSDARPSWFACEVVYLALLVLQCQ
jgi:hypothetical protein